ncbi:TRAP transporter large permease subunit [candidate division KSB1 bacterium]|nr:TRAP transporter large permease subunit [candidate division KSB1 bacterium]
MTGSILILVIVFVFLLFANVPISVCIGMATMLTLLYNMPADPAVTQVSQKIATGLDSFALLAIPFFILSGQLMGKGGIARRLIDTAKAVVGVLPGGLAYVNIFACMLFGAISGSAVAATSAIGSFMIPEMSKAGYNKNFSAAANATASTTGLLIPPSNILIVYSLASGSVSVAALFIAGYIPGILTGFFLMLVAAAMALIHNYRGGDRVGIMEMLKRFVDSFLSLLLIIIVIGGIIAGFFTATEAAAVAVLYAFFLSVVVYREVKLKDLPEILRQTVITNAVVMLLIGTSMALSWVLAYENIPQNISATLIALTESKIIILLIINVILLAVGTFMDATPAVLIFTPIFLPVVVKLGIDPLHFGIMMILNLCIGICTPPVGAVLFVGCAVANTKITNIIPWLLPFFIAMIVSLMLVTFIPELTMYLPRVLGF